MTTADRPKRVRVPREKVPYRDRVPVVLEFCTCIWTMTDDRARIHSVDPKCPLHGDRVERSPF